MERSPEGHVEGPVMKADTIVVGFDGSDNSHRALEAAMELISEQGIVHVVTAFHMRSAAQTAEMMASLPEEFRGSFDLMEGPRTHLHDAETLLAQAGVDHKGHLVEDDPASAILDLADDVGADLVIVGSRGLGRVARFLRGSVSTRVASHARTSFLVVTDHHDDE